MVSDELRYPVAFFDGQACFFERTSAHSHSYFGGPAKVQLDGLRHGPRKLHQIMTLNWDVIQGSETPGADELPLLYGMCFDGCRLEYEFVNSQRCRLLKLEPRESADDWPYSGYPELLPYIPLRVARRVHCSADDFRRLLVQHGEVNVDDVTVIVPVMSDLGVSLWGPSGDAEGVQIVFRVNLNQRRIRATNECS